MTIIKTSELTGAALDWCVAKSEYLHVTVVKPMGGQPQVVRTDGPGGVYIPSTAWSQGGPLIEENHVELLAPCKNDPNWDACVFGVDGLLNGPTPLIAACRAIVAAKLGDEVDVPEELV